MTSEKVVGASLGWPLCGEGPNSDRRTERVLLELGMGGRGGTAGHRASEVAPKARPAQPGRGASPV